MKKGIYVFLVIFIIILFEIIIGLNKNSLIQVNSNGVNNNKIAWGIKRNNNNQQPDLGLKNKELIDKYKGIAIGNNNKKNIYLTFDEGYEAGYTSQILDVLKKNNVKAAFFITGHYFKSQSELVQRMIEEGHIVGNHTNTHPSLPTLISKDKIRKEIKMLEQEVKDKYNYEMKYLRPPMGEYSEMVLETIRDLGYTTVMWSFAYDDWDINNQKGINYAKEKIISNLHPGSVILLHAVSKDNANVLDTIIKESINQGYEFKSLENFER